MKLTLKHLAIAMTYNYSLHYFDDERELLHNDCKIVELREDEMTIANGEYQYDVKFDDVKLLAKPLSDLTKHCEDLGFVPSEWFEKNFNKSISFYNPINLDIPLQIDIETENYSQTIDLFDGYLIVQKLYEWKFDIHGLIENVLAIDINTIEL